MKITSKDTLIDKIQKLYPEAIARIKPVIIRMLILVHATAVKLIQRGPHTEYRKYRRRSIVHWSSAPGEPPASDTGALASSIQWHLAKNGLEGTVGTNLAYGRYLEYGALLRGTGSGRNAKGQYERTGILYPRPWLRPALLANRPKIVKAVEKVLHETIVKRHGRHRG